METRKRQGYSDEVSEDFTTPADEGVVSLEARRRIEVEILLEELAEVIESDGGILTP